MPREIPMPARVVPPLLLPALLLCAACSGGGGGTSPTEPSPPPPAPSPGFASFEVVGAGQDSAISYGGSNLVFCRTAAGWADLWIRFAEQTAADGENGPHLDIDVCNLGDGGAFGPKDPSSTSCTGAMTFDIWWHGAGGAIYFNRAMAPNCGLDVTRNGNTLTGTFDCEAMVEFGGGGEEIDVLVGSFQCSVT